MVCDRNLVSVLGPEETKVQLRYWFKSQKKNSGTFFFQFFFNILPYLANTAKVFKREVRPNGGIKGHQNGFLLGQHL